MNERELLETIKEKVLELATTAAIQQVLIDKMVDKLIELMGEEAFKEWSAPIMEEAAQEALAEVKRMDEEAKAEAIRAMSEGVQFS